MTDKIEVLYRDRLIKNQQDCFLTVPSLVFTSSLLVALKRTGLQWRNSGDPGQIFPPLSLPSLPLPHPLSPYTPSPFHPSFPLPFLEMDRVLLQMLDVTTIASHSHVDSQVPCMQPCIDSQALAEAATALLMCYNFMLKSARITEI